MSYCVSRWGMIKYTMSDRLIPEWAEKLSKTFNTYEFSIEKVTERLTKSIEDIENGNVTYSHNATPVVTYKKRRKIVRDDK